MAFFVLALSFVGTCFAKISVLDNVQGEGDSLPIIVLCDGPVPVKQQAGVAVEPFEKRLQELFKSVEFIDDFMLSVTDEVKPGEGFVSSVKKIFELKKACEGFMKNRAPGSSLAKSLGKKIDFVLYKAKEMIVREPASLVSCELKGGLEDEDILKVLFKDPEEKALFVLKKIKADLKMPFSIPQDSSEQGSCYSKALEDLGSFFSLHRELISLSDKLKKSFLKNLKFSELQGVSFFGSCDLVEYKKPILLLAKSCLESKINDKYVFSGISDRTVLANLEVKCAPSSVGASEKLEARPSLEKEATVCLSKEKVCKKASVGTARATKNKIRACCKKVKKNAQRKQHIQPENYVVGDNDSSGLLLGDLSEKSPKKRNSKKKQQVVDLDFPKIESVVSDSVSAQKIELKIDDLFDVSAPVSLPGCGSSPIEQDVFCEQLASDVPPIAYSAPPSDHIQASCESPQDAACKESVNSCKTSVVSKEEESVLDRAKASVKQSIESLSKLKF